MSTEKHPEAAGLAEALYNAEGFHAADSWATETSAITRGRYEAQAAAALSWLTARLTDDDVVEAGAEAVIRRAGWDPKFVKGTYYRDARAALAAAAGVIGGER